MKNLLKKQELVLCKDDFGDQLWHKIGETLQTLLQAGYCAKVRYDEPGFGIVVIEYGHDENLEPWGDDELMWVTADEYENIICDRETQEVPDSNAT